jgi:translation initiation factor IF-2
MRVHILAKALNVTSKDILAKCQAEGIAVKNHMSTLGAGLEATIREWFSEGAHTTTVEKTRRVDLEKARKKRKKASKKAAPAKPKEEVPAEELATTAVADQRVSARAEGAESGRVESGRVESGSATAVAEPETKTHDREDVPATATAVESAPAQEDADVGAPASTAETTGPAEEVTADDVSAVDVAAEAPSAAPKEEAPAEPEAPLAPAGPQNVPAPAKLSGPRVVRYEAPEEYAIPRRGPRKRNELDADFAGQTPVVADLSGDSSRTKGRRRGGGGGEGKSGRRGGRQSSRSYLDSGEKLREWNDQDLAERRARLRGATGRRTVSRRAASRKGGGQSLTPAAPITEAQVEEPIMVKQLCSAIGVPFQKMFPVLHREHNLMLTPTSTIHKDVAEVLALHFGVELTVVEAKTALDKLKEEHDALPRENLKRRPPIVTVLGHVDHGKTSLLDYIRRARVAKHEDGGITQHISSYHFKKGDVAVTFLDTPGHEAFTALRARGAQLTDVVVLVVAADDGVMPQTVEAINHAKAAQVPVVVALNKIDLGEQNVTRIYTQLVEHGLTPSGDWGGETDVIHTSAATGQGVDELLEHLSTLADVHEYRADPTVPASGTVVEAESRQGVGPVLQVIMREGTLKVGDMVVCGNSFGKVRAIRDDTGKSIRKIGPAMPAELWGMNEVPASGDRFYQVDNMQRAKEIADQVSDLRRIDARASIKKARSLDDLVKQRSEADVSELNVIIKADVDGSVNVLESTLARFPDDEVKLTVLHSGIGAVTDSDVHLADASNAIIIAYRVTAPGKTRRLAEEHGVDIRSYKVIYDVTDDIKKALEGLLTPDEVVEPRGTAEVREVFRITKVGLVAGSYVREGVIGSNHLARVTREGSIIRDNCKFDSLKRFKDDAKEVRSGMECGIRLEGFDDLKVGDIIESFEIVKVARTFDG